jgi:outer membrane protein assembly factor BamB
MTPPPRPSADPVATDLGDPTEHATAEAVVWSDQRAVVVGSSGKTEATPVTGNPVFVDGARYHGWLRAIDAHGAVVWTHRLDRGREVHVRAVAALGGDLVIAGEQRAGDARAYTGWIARIAPSGDERWRLDALGAPGVTGLQAVAVRGDGSVVAGGMQRGKAWLVAVDGHGKLGWDHDLPGLDEVTAAMPAAGGVVIAGVTGRTTTSAGTSRLVAVDPAGAPRWTTPVPDHGSGELHALAPLPDGGVAVGQAPGDDGRDGAWIVRFGPDGAIRSSQVIPTAPPARIGAARAVAATGDGGFVVAGEALDDIQGRRGQVWRFDSAGRLLWHRPYGDAESLVRGIAAMPDGGAIVVGATQPNGSPLRPWIFRIDPQGVPR